MTDAPSPPRPLFLVAATAALAAALIAAHARAATVEMRVTNVAKTAGHVRAALCTQASFLKSDCQYSASAPARAGETVVTFTGVEPGLYAAQVFDDDTDGGEVHQDRLGVPREGVGFSNNAPIHMGGPRFKDAAFSVGENGAHIQLSLRYLSLAKSPGGAMTVGERPAGADKAGAP